MTRGAETKRDIGGRGLRRSTALVAAVVALVASWVGAEPPFAGPDEFSHYLRAVSITTDGLIGEPVPDFSTGDYSAQQLAVVQQEAREVTAPPGLSPEGWTCFVGRPGESAACLDALPPADQTVTEHVTPVGSYPPLPYVLPGLAAALAATPDVADALASIVAAILSVLLLGAGITLAYDVRRGPVSLVGLMVALSPMVLYLAASPNPSGLEVAAGVAFACGLLRLARETVRDRWTTWLVIAVSGAVLALGRSVSPAWVLAHLAVALVWAGPRHWLRMVRAARRPAAATGAVLFAAFVAAFAWTSKYGTEAPIGLEPPAAALAEGVGAAAEAVSRQAIAVFGYLEYNLPGWIYDTWHVLAVALFVLALAVGRWRDRVVLLLVVLGVFSVTVLLHAALLRNTGFPVQGRHVLPVLVVVPLLAGEIVARRLPPRGALAAVVPAVVGIAAAAVHVGAWYAAGRRAAVGVAGPWLYVGRSTWNPPGGWLPWVLLTVAGGALVVVACAPVRPLGRRQPAHGRAPTRVREPVGEA